MNGELKWPTDADGDVFRRLHSQHFDFDKDVEIDFNIDFDVWPPASGVNERLFAALADVKITAHDDGQYLLVQVEAKLTYEFVTSMQTKLTRLTVQFGGTCESWGVFSA